MYDPARAFASGRDPLTSWAGGTRSTGHPPCAAYAYAKAVPTACYLKGGWLIRRAARVPVWSRLCPADLPGKPFEGAKPFRVRARVCHRACDLPFSLQATPFFGPAADGALLY